MKLTVARLGHRGDGVANGIYIPAVLPGEVVEGDVSGDRMTAPRILTPSADRVRPPCPHARACGGCALQHASDAFVARWKVDVVRQALAAQGLTADFRPIQTSPPRSRRRAVLAGRRTKSAVILGFHARASDTVVAIPDCQLLHPDLMAALPALEAITAAGASRKGELALTVTRSDAGPDVSVSGGKPADAALRGKLAQLVEAHRLARLTWDDEVVALRAPPAQIFGSARVVPPPGAFLQATLHGEAALLAAVTGALGRARHVADLFSGCGTFSLPIAARAEVHAVEGEATMLTALTEGWRKTQGLHRVTTEARDLFRRPLLPDELARFDAVVIDPPRAGAEAQTRALANSTVPVIAAVSCNPVTFARDARILCDAGYRLDWVQVVDQFRWSAHVELAALFVRGHMAAEH